MSGRGIAGHHGGGWSPVYHVITVENRAPSQLPLLGARTEACLFATLRGRGTRWGAYWISMPGGTSDMPLHDGLEHFLYVLRGVLELHDDAASKCCGQHATS